MSLLIDREVAKYPFLKQALDLVDSLDIKLEDMVTPNYTKVLDRGAERVIESIVKAEVSAKLADSITELLSFPVAIMYVTVIGEPFLGRRYALGESVRAYNLLSEERIRKVLDIAIQEFGWDIRRQVENIDGISYGFQIHFSDYLSNTHGFREDKWKLLNRVIKDGYVNLTNVEVARLLQVEVEQLIKQKVLRQQKINLPAPIQNRLEKISEVFSENRSKIGAEGLPEKVLNEAFPPCIRYCMEGLLSGRRASHMERFALTSFLVNVGMDINEMVELYTSVTDFDESLTRYQIEHIAGMRGGQTKYTPPTCSTLNTHGICREKDSICRYVRHPLGYYRIKSKQIGGERPDPSDRKNE